jgi:hypothetical protein
MLGKSGYGGGGSTGGGSGGIAATDWRLITGLTQANGNDIGGQITSMTEPVGGEYTWNFDATVAGALAADTGIIWDLRTDSDEDIFAEWAALDQPDAWAWQMLIEILSMPASTATNQWMLDGPAIAGSQSVLAHVQPWNWCGYERPRDGHPPDATERHARACSRGRGEQFI